MSTAIALEGVTRGYGVDRRSGGMQLIDALRGRHRPRRRTVLRDIDLTIAHGEAVAILGRNGAGKSTLLKLIAGIGQPDTGRVTVNGRIGPLIELGAGFHADEDAIANIRTAATFMGAEREDLDRIVEEALAFSELGDHLDKPIKYFSSGMVVRLGFAVIASVRPPILLSDEVLAVGDESFQKRCIAWLEGYLAEGGTLLLVSHSIYHVQKLCQRTIWIHEGGVHADGDVFEVSQAYLAYHDALRGQHAEAGSARPELVEQAVLRGADDRSDSSFAAGENARIDLALRGAEARLKLGRLDGTALWEGAIAGPAKLTVPLPTTRLLPGRYVLEVSCPDGAFRAHRMLFQVAGASRRFGTYRLDHRWS
ncbi:MAG: ATP-binding cassette domain-containing protein [Pseudomonadota bacterium]